MTEKQQERFDAANARATATFEMWVGQIYAALVAAGEGCRAGGEEAMERAESLHANYVRRYGGRGGDPT